MRGMLRATSHCGAAQTTRYLNRRGIPPDAGHGTACSKVPLHVAAEKGFTEIAAALLSFGANVSAQDEYGCAQQTRH